MHPKKDIIALVVVVLTIRPPPVDLSYSKRGRRHPWCVDGTCALGWGAAATQAMVGSKPPATWCAGNEFRVLTHACENTL